MEYVLVDIKNFLRKLENGQLEIEAGQWELHKALSNMNKVVSDLKNLREDVEDMRLSSLQQMGLIKELQIQLDKLNKMREDEQPETVSESSVEYERVYKRPLEAQGFKKRKCRIRSEEIIEITSQVSNEKSESGVEEPAARIDQCQADTEGTEFTATPNEQISDEESSQNAYKTESYTIPKVNPPKCHFATHTANNDMLQRYLKDSVKYVERKSSNSTELTHHSSHQSDVEKTHSAEYTPFWDEYSSRAPPETHCENRSAKVVKENSTVTEAPVENILPKRFLCPKCPKKFMHKTDTFRHERKHRTIDGAYYCKSCGKGYGNRERLRDHEACHRISRTFKGFRCSYCGKICNCPESLTSHLRNCRIIMKAHYKKK